MSQEITYECLCVVCGHQFALASKDSPHVCAECSKAKHTPGPWKVDFEKHYCGAGEPGKTQARAVKAGNRTVAAVLCAWRKKDERSDADTRLISAAPDLLAACKEMLRSLRLAGQDDPKAAAAIAKAEGRP